MKAGTGRPKRIATPLNSEIEQSRHYKATCASCHSRNPSPQAAESPPAQLAPESCGRECQRRTNRLTVKSTAIATRATGKPRERPRRHRSSAKGMGRYRQVDARQPGRTACPLINASSLQRKPLPFAFFFSRLRHRRLLFDRFHDLRQDRLGRRSIVHHQRRLKGH